MHVPQRGIRSHFPFRSPPVPTPDPVPPPPRPYPRPPRAQISDAFKQGARSTVPELLARGRPLGKALDAAVTDLVNRAMQDLGLNHRRTLHAGDVHVGAPPSDDRIKECVPLPHSPCLSTSPSPRTPCL